MLTGCYNTARDAWGVRSKVAAIATLPCSEWRCVPYKALLRNISDIAGMLGGRAEARDSGYRHATFFSHTNKLPLLFDAGRSSQCITVQQAKHGLGVYSLPPGDLPTTDVVPNVSSSVSLSVRPVESSSLSGLLGGDAKACSGQHYCTHTK